MTELQENKCYNCGKNFKYPKDLERHKGRKTPCLIREVTPEDRHNPNRCIFCNKIFSTKGNLIKHLSTCKIKNGGMNILDDKVQHEQKIRILEEQQMSDREKIQKMEEKMAEMAEKMAKMETQPTVINNSVINNTTTTNNIIINFHSYDKPKLDTLKLTPQDLLVESVHKKLIELIYFNKTLPENHVLWRPNIKEQRLLVYKDGDWKTIINDNLQPVFNSVKSIAGSEGSFKLDYGGDLYSNDLQFTKLPYGVQASIKKFFTEEKILDGTIMEIITEGRDIVRETLENGNVI